MGKKLKKKTNSQREKNAEKNMRKRMNRASTCADSSTPPIEAEASSTAEVSTGRKYASQLVDGGGFLQEPEMKLGGGDMRDQASEEVCGEKKRMNRASTCADSSAPPIEAETSSTAEVPTERKYSSQLVGGGGFLQEREMKLGGDASEEVGSEKKRMNRASTCADSSTPPIEAEASSTADVSTGRKYSSQLVGGRGFLQEPEMKKKMNRASTCADSSAPPIEAETSSTAEVPTERNYSSQLVGGGGFSQEREMKQTSAPMSGYYEGQTSGTTLEEKVAIINSIPTLPDALGREVLFQKKLTAAEAGKIQRLILSDCSCSSKMKDALLEREVEIEVVAEDPQKREHQLYFSQFNYVDDAHGAVFVLRQWHNVTCANPHLKEGDVVLAHGTVFDSHIEATLTFHREKGKAASEE